MNRKKLALKSTIIIPLPAISKWKAQAATARCDAAELAYHLAKPGAARLAAFAAYMATEQEAKAAHAVWLATQPSSK